MRLRVDAIGTSTRMRLRRTESRLHLSFNTLFPFFGVAARHSSVYRSTISLKDRPQSSVVRALAGVCKKEAQGESLQCCNRLRPFLNGKHRVRK